MRFKNRIMPKRQSKPRLGFFELRRRDKPRSQARYKNPSSFHRGHFRGAKWRGFRACQLRRINNEQA